MERHADSHQVGEYTHGEYTHADGSTERMKSLKLRTCRIGVLAVAMVLVLGSSAMAAPGWLTLDANLSDWGLDMASGDWTPNILSGGQCVYVLDDDQTAAGTGSGGEWYDIEALYMHFQDIDDDTQYMSWAIVTSYGGVEAWDYNYYSGEDAKPDSNNPVSLRNDDYDPQSKVAYPYRRHPVISLAFNGQFWPYGLILAPSYDVQWDGTNSNWDFTNSVGLDDPNGPYPQGASAESNHDFGYGSGEDEDNYRTYDADGALDSFSDTAELWSVDKPSWRDAHPSEFGTGGSYYNPTAYPVDFDVSDTTNNSVLATGETFVGRADGASGRMDYEEDEQDEWTTQLGSPWWQADNYIWEGWVSFPKSEIDFTQDWESVSIHYSQWCGNDDGTGDAITYGGVPPYWDNSPELGTWALLLCTGALGGWIRRRRTD